MWTEKQLQAKIKKGKVRIKNNNETSFNSINQKRIKSKSKESKAVLQQVGNEILEVTDTPKIYIGIDPDSDKSGIAVWDASKQDFILLDALSFFDLLDTIDKLVKLEAYRFYEFIFLVEYGKANKIILQGKDKVHRARCVGWNESRGVLFCEYLERKKLNFKKVVPKRNRYARFGVLKGKISQSVLNNITGSRYQTKINPFKSIRKSKLNQEIRDALMLVYNLY